jgi:hypothetical protein
MSKETKQDIVDDVVSKISKGSLEDIKSNLDHFRSFMKIKEKRQLTTEEDKLFFLFRWDRRVFGDYYFYYCKYHLTDNDAKDVLNGCDKFMKNVLHID